MQNMVRFRILPGDEKHDCGIGLETVPLLERAFEEFKVQG
jgi:hypothetical protein